MDELRAIRSFDSDPEDEAMGDSDWLIPVRMSAVGIFSNRLAVVERVTKINSKSQTGG